MALIERPHPLATPGEAAAMFGVNVKTLTQWAKTGKLPEGEAFIWTPGGQRLYRRVYLQQFIDGGRP
jgi:hypothetical protein